MSIWTVSQLNRQARQVLERDFTDIEVEGEISDLLQHRSGHWYFTLKDDEAQLRSAMFRFQNRKVRFTPENGQQVVLRGRLSLYEPRGSYQFIAEQMQPAGLGKLQRQFELLKQQLQERGWFDPAIKKPLPDFPARVAVITSPQGAAVRDICTTFRRRCPAIELLIVPVAVQGDDAAPTIASAIERINELTDKPSIEESMHVDAIIVARGGGSLEDLWAFNEEIVATAIFHSRLPVVSAVGHETDTTIADWVADVRAPTPTAAAELLSPSAIQLRAGLQQIETRLMHCLRGNVHQRRLELAACRARLRHPQHQLSQLAQGFDQLELRALRALQVRQRQARQRLQHLTQSLQTLNPATRVAGHRVALQQHWQRALRGIAAIQQQQSQRLALAVNALQVVSPLATLERGYSITRDERGTVLRDVCSLQEGDTIETRLTSGTIHSAVTSVHENAEKKNVGK